MPPLKTESSEATPSGVEALQCIARKLFWWKLPEEALADTIRFAAQVMTYGNWEDVQTAKAELGEEVFRQTLLKPPPGVFDARSWVYWHHYFRIDPIPPLPKRTFT
jgi:hypothetical protein